MRRIVFGRAIGLLVLALASFACKSDFAKSDAVDEVDAGDDGGGGDAGDGTNQPPVAVDDAASTRTERPVEIWLTSNDTDPNEGDELIVSEVVQPTNGFVEILLGAERVQYTSLADFVGIDQFDYTVSDQLGGTDQATVTVNVEEVPILTLEITSPEDAEVVEGPDVRISFEVTGCVVSSSAANPDECHLHKFLDGAVYRDEDGEGFGHHSSADFTISPIEEGEHEFMLELMSNDGSDAPVDPYISDSVTFEVTIPAG